MSETTLLAKTVRLLALVFIVSVYSIAVLSTVDDASILLNRSITIIPIISAKITSSLFFGLMPVIVLLLYHYFQYSLVSLKTRVNRHDAHKPEADPSDADSIFADLLGIQLRRHARFSNYAATAISHFTVWVIAPLTIFLAWIRYLPRHDLLGSYYHALILWLLLALPVMRYSFRRTSRRQASRIVLFSVTIVAALMLLVTHSLARGIPGVCFETKPHDLNHPFFEYQLVEHECRARGHWVARLVIRQWLNAGLSLGADLIYVDLSPKLRPGEPSMGPFVFPHLDLTNVRAIALVMPSALLPYANLTGAALPSSGLSDSNLKYATLYMTDLREAKLRETSFIRTTLSYVDFDHAKMESSGLTGLDRKGAVVRC